MYRVGQNHIYIRCVYGNFGREITKYTVIYGVYIWFWPTLNMYQSTLVLHKRNRIYTSKKLCINTCTADS